ncbi:hypothetical protein [Derxia lacustris]|uniref:hypothetical protein n=1 Tax=Derxia lacustris TaxID=764842 RepID=UPI001C380DB7|nr:hypothetical protein [Derxia lacustris]
MGERDPAHGGGLMRWQREVSEPDRAGLSWPELWAGPDCGLIASWERGRQKAGETPELAAAAGAGELVLLPWKGGVEQPTKTGRKVGSLLYLAMWQGLRGEPLDVDLACDVQLTCSRHGVMVTFTGDSVRIAKAR